MEFIEKSRTFRERINLLILRSNLRKYYDGCEILAFDERNDASLIIHFLLNFDPIAKVTSEELRKMFAKEFEMKKFQASFFKNMKIDHLQIKEINFFKFDDFLVKSSAQSIDIDENLHDEEFHQTQMFSLRTCEPIKLEFCRHIINYNLTTFPNFIGHQNYEEIEKDLITFREVVDSECFLQAHDFLCHLLQPPCELFLDLRKNQIRVKPRLLCRGYCQDFADGCLSRIPKKFREFFDCENYPEQSSIQSCRHRPSCLADLKRNGQDLRICDGMERKKKQTYMQGPGAGL